MKKSKILEKNAFNQLDFSNFNKKFDIIFMDPPYKEKLLPQLLKKILKAKILDDEGIVIIHRHKNENDDLDKFFNILEEKNYGISKIIFGKFF